MKRCSRFQFSLKDLFLAVTLIAVGLGGSSAAIQAIEKIGRPAAMLICLASLTAIGAGLGAPFQKKKRGASVAFFLWLSLCAMMLTSWLLPHHDDGD